MSTTLKGLSRSGKIRLSAPGKTFLLGEYLAVLGGPSVLLSTKPRFELIAQAAQGKGTHDLTGAGISSLSPAGRLYEKYQKSFCDLDLRFCDPHECKGGLGASSAQFVLMLALKNFLESEGPKFLAELPPRDVLNIYREMAWNGEGAPPSGADVVSHIHGGVTFFEGRSASLAALSWDFPDMSFTLLRTGEKLATHEHLKRGFEVPEEELRSLVNLGQHAFRSKTTGDLIESVNRYGEVLKASGLLARHTDEALKKIRIQPGILAAKGCGAMGADIIVVVHENEAARGFRVWAKDSGLIPCGGLEDLDVGLKIED